MEKMNGINYLNSKELDNAFWEILVNIKELPKLTALDKIHNEKENVGILKRIMHINQVWMINGRHY